MEVKKITDSAFRKYGRIVDLDLADLGRRLDDTKVTEDVVYVPSDASLEDCAEFDDIQNSLFGGMPVQIGYCNGRNHLLNAVEYHRDSEINFTQTGAVLMLGCLQDVGEDYTYDTALMEAFCVPSGTAVELYGTTLHYAPCSLNDRGFRVAVILPRGTNTETPQVSGKSGEDKLLTARNKWLIAHEDSGLGKEGAFVGLVGENLSINC